MTKQQQQIEHLKLKIGETTADLHITITQSGSDDKTPRVPKHTKISAKQKKESGSIKSRAKPQVISNHQQVQAKGGRDRQLEDLNETLQRLAREKVEGRGPNAQGNKKKSQRHHIIQESPNSLQQQMEYFQDDPTDFRKKKKIEANFNKYRLEKSQRMPQMMGENVLVSQRLQGVKQVVASPTIGSHTNSEKKGGFVHTATIAPKHQFSTPNNSKIYKINRADVRLKNQVGTAEIYRSQEDDLGSLGPEQNIPSSQSNLRHINYSKKRNIIVESAIPTFGQDQVSLNDQLQNEWNPVATQIQADDEFEVNDRADDAQAEAQAQNLKLRLECRFSSVTEDVEQEQLTSPSALAHREKPSIQRHTMDETLSQGNHMKAIKFMSDQRKQAEMENQTRNLEPNSTFSIASPSQTIPENIMITREEEQESPIKNIQGAHISPLEVVVDGETPKINKQVKDKPPGRETNYSQVFNLQTSKLEQSKQQDPSATLGKDTLAQALNAPAAPTSVKSKNLQTQRTLPNSSRYNSNVVTNRVSHTSLDLELRSPAQQSNGSERKEATKPDPQPVNITPQNERAREDSEDSSKSSPAKKHRVLVNHHRHQSLYTPRPELSVQVGEPIEHSNIKTSHQSPQVQQEKRTSSRMNQINNVRGISKLQSQMVVDQDLTAALGGVKHENSYLPQIDPKSTSKSPIRGTSGLKPPVAPSGQRNESMGQTTTKIHLPKSSRRRQDIRKQQKTQVGPSLTKFEIQQDDSSDVPDRVRALRLGVPIRSKRDNVSFCQEYCQYRGQQIPRQQKELFTHNKFRKTEAGPVWSQRLFMSKECAQSEDRRMMPVLIINLDGAMGYWDDTVKNHYVVRQKAIESLITLSHDFRLVAVSSQKQKLIFKLIHGLMNMPAQDDQGHIDTNQLRHLYFDAVYQLQSTNDERKLQCTQKSIDHVHYDLTQALLDMQFKRQKSSAKKEEQIEPEGAKPEENFQTFWESDQYRPFQKVLIFTAEQYLNKNHCYSFDYNYLFQASKFNNESSRKSPIVIQLPHLRVNPKITFEIVHQMVFCLQYLSHAKHLESQANHLIINGKLYENPELSSFEICKKLLSLKWRQQEIKIKYNLPKGLRVFDADNDPYVNLEHINFNHGYKFLKKYLKDKTNNWLQVKKYYLKPRPSKQDKINKMKMIAKVTFNDSPEIIRMGEDNGSQVTKAVGTTHDSSKAESVKESKTTMYMSDDAKNHYNGLMIRNFKMQQEINSYARHHRIQNQAKQAHLKQMETKNAADQCPIVIFDGDKEQEKPRSSLKQYTNTKSSMNNQKKEKPTVPSKAYSFKYRALLIKSGEIYEQWQTNDCDLSKFQVVSLKQSAKQSSFEKNMAAVGTTPGTNAQLFTAIQQQAIQNTTKAVLEKPCKLNLIDYLCKRQTRINYTTSQEMHLKNNLSQLVEGKQQYADQQKNITEQEGTDGKTQQLPNINDKDNNSKPEHYIDGL